MKTSEADFSIKFRHWLMKNPMMSCQFEMKDTRGKDSMPFSEIKQEQIDNALATKYAKGGNLIRIASGTIGGPDYAYYHDAYAFFVINYPKGFVIIDAETLALEMKKKKSLSWNRCCDIAYKIVLR